MQITFAFTNNVLTQAAYKLASNSDVREMYISSDAGYYDNIDEVLSELVSAKAMQALHNNKLLFNYVYSKINKKLAKLITA